MSEEDQEEFRAKVLGLEGNRFTLLLAAASSGANHHRKLLDVLKGLSDRLQAIVICGKDEGVYRFLKRWKARNPDFPLFLEGYSNQVPKLIQASNAVVTRPGSNTSAEALYFGCPLIFNGIGGSRMDLRARPNLHCTGQRSRPHCRRHGLSDPRRNGTTQKALGIETVETPWRKCECDSASSQAETLRDGTAIPEEVF